MSSNVDVPTVLAHKFNDIKCSYTERDVALYALTVGAADDPLDAEDLPLVYEMNGDMVTLPTFAVTFPFAGMSDMMSMPGLSFNPMMLLHGEQEVKFFAPIPTAASVTSKMKVTGVYDKGKGALIFLDSESFDAAGNKLCWQRNSIFIRGIGGFGGERGPKPEAWKLPNRAPDKSMSYKTANNQALTYRLNGDTNPLHADANMAAMGGFERPILHGLCSFGVAGRCILKAFCSNDVTKFKSIKGRFAKHVFPGETLVTDMWHVGGGKILYRTRVVERDSIVITNGVAEVASDGSAADSGGDESKESSGSAALFEMMKTGIAADGANLVKQVNAVIVYKITKPDATWVVDLKNGSGSVTRGEPSGRADLTVTVSDADFVALANKKLNPQQAFMRGKIKVKGNMGIAMKLGKVLDSVKPPSKL